MKDVHFARGRVRSIGSHRSTIALGFGVAVCLLNSLLSGCATPPTVPPPTAPASPPLEATVREPRCPSCEDQVREIARLRQELANRDAELRDLRTDQRNQVKVLQESTQEVTRAKVKLRRIATQADAASYIAEVEVAMASLRSSHAAASTLPLTVLAQDILDSTAAPFAQGDYGLAMDRAAQAEQLIALMTIYRAGPGSRKRVPGEVPLQVAIPLKVTVDSSLRRHPLGKAPVVQVLKKDSPLVAHAFKGSWMRVETEDGRSGWVVQSQLGTR